MEKSHFEYRQDFERLLQENNLLQAQIGALEQDSKALRESISSMRRAQEYLLWDVNELYGTIKADIERKNNIINDLRRRLIECGVTPRDDRTKSNCETSVCTDNGSCRNQVDDANCQNNLEPVTDKRQPNLEVHLSPKVSEKDAKLSTRLNECSTSKIHSLNDQETLTQPARELKHQNLVELPTQAECSSPERRFSSEEDSISIPERIPERVETNESAQDARNFVGSLEGYRIPKKKPEQPTISAPNSIATEDSGVGRCRSKPSVETEQGECLEEGEIDADDHEILNKPTEIPKSPSKINRPCEDFSSSGRPQENPRNNLNFDSRQRHPTGFRNYDEWRRWDERDRRTNKWHGPVYARRPNQDFPRNDRDSYRYSDQRPNYYNQRIPRQDRLTTLDLADNYSRGNIRDSNYQGSHSRERRMSVDSIDSLQRVSYQPEPEKSQRSGNLINPHPEECKETKQKTEKPAVDGNVHDLPHTKRELAKHSSAERIRLAVSNEAKVRDRKIREKGSSKDRARNTSKEKSLKTVENETEKRIRDTSKEGIKKNIQKESFKNDNYEAKQQMKKDTVPNEKKTKNDRSPCKADKENKSATKEVTETKIQKQHGRKPKEKPERDEKLSKTKSHYDKKRTIETTQSSPDKKRRKVNENSTETGQKHLNKNSVENGDNLIQSNVQPDKSRETAQNVDVKTKDSNRKDELHYLFGDYSSDSSSTSSESSEDIRPISIGRKDKTWEIQPNQKAKKGKTKDAESDDCRIFERTRSRAKNRLVSAEQTSDNKFEVYKEQRSLKRCARNTTPEIVQEAPPAAHEITGGPSVEKLEEHALRSLPKKDGAAPDQLIKESLGAEMSNDGSIPVMHIPDFENPFASSLLETSFIKSVIDCNSTLIDDVLNGRTTTPAPHLNSCMNNSGSTNEDPKDCASSAMLTSNDSNASDGHTSQMSILQNDLHLSFDSSGNENTVVKKVWVSPNRRRRKVTMFLNSS